MSSTLAVMVEEIDDGVDEGSRNWNDWTPRERRVLARRLQVDTSFGYVYLEETKKDDPTHLHMYVTTTKIASRSSCPELDFECSVAQLNEMIDAMVLARDAAIANWMIEPGV
jgi:hypothetical protein